MRAVTPPAADVASAPAAEYAGADGRFDECRGADGGLRPAWDDFFRLLGPNPADALRAATEVCRRSILEQDVSMNVYAGEQSDARPWPLDVVPLLLGTGDWDLIAAGLRQRAHLYNALLQDLYGPQKLLRQGALPAALAMANPHFLRACAGLGRQRAPFLHTYAADIGRSPDGRWWVIEDRLDAPSGLGYSLQNRIIVRQALPEIFHGAPVQRLYRFFRAFRASLEKINPGAESARVVFLTPGAANETYFEHAYLARYLGYPLVEGEDLTTRDRRVFLRTVGGLKGVDVVMRRVDSEFCDPLELDERSLLGVPGLVAAARAGRVVVANQIGARALETTALLAFLEPLCRMVLGEKLRLPSAATWWCGQPEAQRYVLEHLDTLVVKPTFPSPDAAPTRYGALLDADGRAALADEIRARPGAFCGQERVLLGTTPGWDAAAARLRPVSFVARVFLSWDDGDYHAMPGGLTRCNPTGEDAIVSLQAGSMTKDTWVLDPDSKDTLTPSIASTLGATTRHPHATPSRLADNLFWLGRYLDRTGQLARLVDRLDPLVSDEIAMLDPIAIEDAVRLVLDLQQIVAPPGTTVEALAARARNVATSRGSAGSLAANLANLTRILANVKVRLPREAWHIARDLRRFGTDPQVTTRLLCTQLSSLDGVLSETLPRDTGWRFLDLGRAIERGCQVLHVLRRVAAAPGGAAPTDFRLQTALHLADCLFAYRSVFQGAFHPAPVLGWLIGDAENALSLRFQAERIGQHLAALPDELSPRSVEALRDHAFHLLSTVRLADPAKLADDPDAIRVYAHDLLRLHGELSDRITQVYFSHVESSDVAENG